MAIVSERHGFALGSSGPEQAKDFEETYLRTFTALVAYCARFAPTHADAEDLAQETLCRAWTAWDARSHDRPTWPWLATIARRVCIDAHRAEDRRAARQQRAAVPESHGSVDDAFVEDDDARRALAALRSLPAGYQRLVALRDIEEWSYSEIAALEGVTVESVRGSLRRARSALRRRYLQVSALFVFPGWRARRTGLGSAATGAPPSVADVVALAVAAAVTAAVLSSASLPRAASSEAPTSRPAAAAVADPAGPLPMDDAPVVGPPREVGVAGAAAPAGVEHASRAPTGPLADDVSSPDQVAFTAVTASPDFRRDGTLFAVGLAGQGCLARCDVLFRSVDHGVSWQRLEAAGFVGGEVLLPPAFPSDARIFSVSPLGLQLSEDDGATFRTVSAVGWSAAMSPGFNLGDPRIVLGDLGGWVYDADTGTTTPLVSGDRSARRVAHAFSPRYLTTGTWYRARTVDVPGAGSEIAIERCAAHVCSAPVMPGLHGLPTIEILEASAGEVVIAWNPDGMMISRDGGRSFESTHLGIDGAISSVIAAEGAIVAVVDGRDGERVTSKLVWSADAGRSWQLPTQPLQGQIVGLHSAPFGHTLALPSGRDGGGVLCSTDGSTSWKRSC